MTPPVFRAEPDCTSDGAPEVDIFANFGDLYFAGTMTPEAAYALAAELVQAADQANALAARRREAARK